MTLKELLEAVDGLKTELPIVVQDEQTREYYKITGTDYKRVYGKDSIVITIDTLNEILY